MFSGRYMAYSPSPSAPLSPHLAGLRSATTAFLEQEKCLMEYMNVKENVGLKGLAAVIKVSGDSSNAWRAEALGRPVVWVARLIRRLILLISEHHKRRLMSGLQPSSAQSWIGSQGSSSGLIAKRTIRVDIPVDQYPNYNFVGRLLGPRGNSLKRVEVSTECRVLIRGRGSIKDPAKEEIMRGKPGYEHLNEPLHILVEAELPVEMVDARLMQAREILEDLLKPMDESQDFYKKQQLRELALINGTLRDEDSQMSGSVSPFHNNLARTRLMGIAGPAKASNCLRGTGTFICQLELVST
ncbi:hypothetical protein C3L33_11482, partial [Rhododendron williamsianum]